MAVRHRLSEEMRWRAIGRLEAGQRQSAVARWLNVHRSIVSRLWNRFQTSQSISRRPVPGRPRATSTREDRYLLLNARRHRTYTARQLASDLSATTGRAVSRQTVSRRLHDGNLYARRPVVCVPLTSSHRRARFHWSREHRDWTQRQWATVLFTDESRFSLQTDSRRLLLWREPGTRYHPANTLERDTFGGGGLLVWAGITINGRTDLHVFPRGTVTGVRYRDEILEPYVRPFVAAMGPDAMLMDDNARPHRARLVDHYLESETIIRMEWPSKSPDLNPIEHVWDALGRRVAGLCTPPRTLQELRAALLQEWHLIPQTLIDNLIRSMESRCRACIAVRGDHTPY